MGIGNGGGAAGGCEGCKIVVVVKVRLVVYVASVNSRSKCSQEEEVVALKFRAEIVV